MLYLHKKSIISFATLNFFILHSSFFIMLIRRTTQNDIPRLMEIFAIARQFMQQTGNPTQWGDDYPSPSLLLDDIARGDSFVCEESGHILATFVLRGGNDPTYDHIYSGAWTNDNPYATIHRIASSGEKPGMFAAAVRYALQTYATLRIDTHEDNKVMQRLIIKNGFRYCGIIHCWNGSPRLAYQYN